MKSMNLTYSHKELQWLFFAAVVAGLNSALKMKGYFITFQVTDDSFCYEFWKAASASEKDDGGLISSHKVNKGEYQMNDIRPGVMVKYLEDEANKFMNAISNNQVEKAFNKGDEGLILTNFHAGKEFPTEILLEGEKEGYSKDVLIDIDGYRKNFRTGWYDFDEKKWRLYDKEAEKEIDLEGLRWTELPLDRIK